MQCINAMLLFFAVYYHFLSNAILVFMIVAYEGLLGGAAYVNTFHFISKEVSLFFPSPISHFISYLRLCL